MSFRRPLFIANKKWCLIIKLVIIPILYVLTMTCIFLWFNPEKLEYDTWPKTLYQPLHLAWNWILHFKKTGEFLPTKRMPGGPKPGKVARNAIGVEINKQGGNREIRERFHVMHDETKGGKPMADNARIATTAFAE